MQARMRQMSLLAVLAVTLVVVLGGTALAQSSNPNVGIWKLNVAKSKYTPAGVGFKSMTVKIEAAGAGIKTIVDAVDAADGTVRHWEITADYDGKDHPVVGNSPNGDTVARTRINATTTKTVNKQGGKITVIETIVVSSNGRTRTITVTGTNALGQTVNNELVFEKQ
jgi:hypothetical protein